MSVMFDYAVQFAQCASCWRWCAQRFAWSAGPAAQDRVLALDALYVNGMLTLLILGIRSRLDRVLRHGVADRAVRVRRLARARQVPACAAR